MAGFESYREHPEQGSGHHPQCPCSATPGRVLPLCSPSQGAAPPARDAAPEGTVLSRPRMSLGHRQTAAAAATCRGENRGHSPASRSQADWSHPGGTRYLLPTLEQCRGTPGARPGLLARRALSTGRDSTRGGPGRDPFLPARLCPPASHPGRGLRAAPASPFFNGMLQHGERRSLKGRGEPERASRLHKGLI